MILVIGFYSDLVEDLLRAHPQHRVLVIEEADLIESMDPRWLENPRVRLRPGAYQQSLEAVDVGVAWFRSEPFDAVVAGREYGVRATQSIAARLGLRGPGQTAVELCTDKLAMREMAARHGLTKGRFAAVDSPSDVRSFMADSSVVLKPRSRHASLGVVRIDTADDVEAAWRRAVSSQDQGGLTQSRHMHWDYMVEEFVAGSGEFSIESLVRDGAAVFSNITQKSMKNASHFSPTGHVLPADITDEIASALRDAESLLLKCAEIADGIAHSEWIWTDTGPHLVECAARFPGGGLSRLLESVYGLNIADSLVRLLAGEESLPNARPNGVAAVHFLAGKEGKLISVEGLDFLQLTDWVTDYRISITAGAEISRMCNSLHRIGHVMVTADTHADLAERLRFVQDQVMVLTDASGRAPSSAGSGSAAG